MNLQQVKALDKIVTAAGYTVTDYRQYKYEQNYRLITAYWLMIEDEPGHEVAIASQANFDIRRFDRIFD